jgi:sensor histidine kinase regulating citrate/malate metabolism
MRALGPEQNRDKSNAMSKYKLQGNVILVFFLKKDDLIIECKNPSPRLNNGTLNRILRPFTSGRDNPTSIHGLGLYALQALSANQGGDVWHKIRQRNLHCDSPNANTKTNKEQ